MPRGELSIDYSNFWPLVTRNMPYKQHYWHYFSLSRNHEKLNISNLKSVVTLAAIEVLERLNFFSAEFVAQVRDVTLHQSCGTLSFGSYELGPLPIVAGR